MRTQTYTQKWVAAVALNTFIFSTVINPLPVWAGNEQQQQEQQPNQLLGERSLDSEPLSANIPQGLPNQVQNSIESNNPLRQNEQQNNDQSEDPVRAASPERIARDLRISVTDIKKSAISKFRKTTAKWEFKYLPKSEIRKTPIKPLIMSAFPARTTCKRNFLITRSWASLLS